ncbi:MAG TPA: Gfo/Idh/MocA family oxidoreductase [Chthoniobacterales bacterium]|nr:Gfo/Idh/MocA family oxidoreductase [Chthoniobacterales bacterium]
MSLLHPIKERADGRKVRYAVVGAGWIAQEDFMPGVEKTGNSILAALVTGDAEKGRELSQKYSIDEVCDYDGFDDLLKSGKIDAIYLATPNTMHRDFTIRALEAGIHVLCEKPMAPTVEDCRAMIAAGKNSGAKLMIAYRLHFEEGTLAAIEAVRAGKIGAPRIFSSLFAQQVEPSNHRTEGDKWAGPLPDMGPYPINGVRNLFGVEPLEAFARAVRRDDARFAEVPEIVSVWLRFPEDRVAQFTVSYGSAAVGEYRVSGTKGDLLMTPGFGWQTGQTLTLTNEGKTEETKFDKVDHFAGETKYFSDCILDDKEPEPDGEEGLCDVCVIKAIEKSIASGKPEPVEQIGRGKRPSRDQVMKLPASKAPELINAKSASRD